MEPLQVWLPILNHGSAGGLRDRRRAIREWGGESRIWLRPSVQDPFTVETDLRFGDMRVVPSEELDRIDIFHVDSSGEVFGVVENGRFASASVAGLLDEWLNCPISVVSAPRKVSLGDAPRLVNGEVVIERLVGRPTPLGSFQTALVGETLVPIWPPSGQSHATVSPDQESSEAVGPMRGVFEGDHPIAVKERTGELNNWFSLRWPDSIQGLTAGGDGIDAVLARSHMRSVAGLSTHDPKSAVLEASKLAALHVEDGHTYRALAWFQPLFTKGGEDRVLFHAEDHGFRATSYENLYEMEGFKDFVREKLPIRRAWGVVGLFWALLLDRLKEGRVFAQCKQCQALMSGRRGKLYCSRRENPVCFAKRRSADQRRSRTKRKQ